MTAPPLVPARLPPFAFGRIPPGVLPLKAACCVFDLCQFQSYISIKDQMIRARLITEWLASTGTLASEIKSVLVVGAGVAGACTAALLAEYRTSAGASIKVTLVDEGKRPFTLQEACDSRFVSLTQYDWPGRHFDAHEWPKAGDIFQANVVPGSGFRLLVPSIPTRASDLVKQWRIDFDAFRATAKNLVWLPGTKASLPVAQPAQPPVTVSMTTASTGTAWSEDCDLVIMACGFGQETIPEIGGSKVAKAFWEDDDYADPAIHAGTDFAIVGFGDGALQDLMRLLCAPHLRSASDVVDRIKAVFLAGDTVARNVVSSSARVPHILTASMIATLGPPAEEAWLQMLRDVADVDRQATLAAPWDTDDGRGMADLQADVAWVVGRFALSHANTLVPAIDAALRSPPDALASVTLIAPQREPSKCYMLNRFLYTLIRWRLTTLPTRVHPRLTLVQERVDPAQLTQVGGKFHFALPNPLQVDQVIWRVGIGGGKPASLVEGFRVAIGKSALPFYPPDRFR